MILRGATVSVQGGRGQKTFFVSVSGSWRCRGVGEKEDCRHLLRQMDDTLQQKDFTVSTGHSCRMMGAGSSCSSSSCSSSNSHLKLTPKWVNIYSFQGLCSNFKPEALKQTQVWIQRVSCVVCECRVGLVLVPAGWIEALVGRVFTCRTWSTVLVVDVLKQRQTVFFT